MEVIPKYSSIQKLVLTLDRVTQAKVARLVSALSEKGVVLGMPFSRVLGNGLYELRIVCKQNVRVLYAQHGGKIYLLHAIIKKSQKLPKKDLELALDRLRALQDA